jgi:hypothetical protein
MSPSIRSRHPVGLCRCCCRCGRHDVCSLRASSRSTILVVVVVVQKWWCKVLFGLFQAWSMPVILVTNRCSVRVMYHDQMTDLLLLLRLLPAQDLYCKVAQTRSFILW